MMYTEKQAFIEGDTPLFSLSYLPDPSQRKNSSVLLLQPFVEERKSSVKVMRSVAVFLAEKGFCTLLFDFSGCGDSCFREKPATAGIDIWMDDIERAENELRRIGGNDNIVIIAFRMAAFSCIVRNLKFSREQRLILIAPVLDPVSELYRTFRGKLVKELMTDSVSTSRNDLMDDLANSKTVDLDGHSITGSFFGSLKRYSEDYDLSELSFYDGEVDMVFPYMLESQRRKIQSMKGGSRTRIHPLKMNFFWVRGNDGDEEILIRKLAEIV